MRSVAVAACFALVLVCHPVRATTIYVDDSATNGLNDGSNWDDAFIELQSALAVAESTDEIRVAQGTYKPDFDVTTTGHTGVRTATFRLANSVAIYGGYAGAGAPDPDQRDVTTYDTILSGDLSDNDIPVACTQDSPDCGSYGGICMDGTCIADANKWENSFRVVTGSGTDSTAILDGFTITGAHAKEAGPTNFGGGLYNFAGSPTVRSCNFVGNSGTYGGGMYNREGSSPTVTKCTFFRNGTGWGGGMYNLYLCNPSVTDCTFVNNVGGSEGGGMCNDRSSPSVDNCTFEGNASVTSGGGMLNKEGAPTVTNSTFIGNRSKSWGGGMLNSFSDTTLIGCLFNGNTAERGGGLRDGAGVGGGGTTMINCTFTANSASLHGGALYVASSPTMINCILWGNAPQQVYLNGGVPVLNYSIIEGGWSGAGGLAVIDSDPLFLDPVGLDGLAGTADDDLRLDCGSPAMDAGSNGALPPGVTTDLDGKARFVDVPLQPDCQHGGNCGAAPVVDMGAYEYQGTADGSGPDCNSNGMLDSCDLAAGTASDCNGNLVPDECDHVPGDFDGDGTVGEGDLGAFIFCLKGPDFAIPDCHTCEIADTNHDHHIDLIDFAAFQQAYRAP